MAKKGEFVERIPIICRTCNKQFYVIPSQANTAKYCSRPCQFEGLKNRKISDEVKANMKEGAKHRKKYCMSLHGKINISLGRTGKKVFDGFITPETKRVRRLQAYKDWRLMVFGRDDFTCQVCGKRGCYLEAHHIKTFAEYPKLRFNIDNGVTLCRPCHMKAHGWNIKGDKNG